MTIPVSVPSFTFLISIIATSVVCAKQELNKPIPTGMTDASLVVLFLSLSAHLCLCQLFQDTPDHQQLHIAQLLTPVTSQREQAYRLSVLSEKLACNFQFLLWGMLHFRIPSFGFILKWGTFLASLWIHLWGIHFWPPHWRRRKHQDICLRSALSFNWIGSALPRAETIVDVFVHVKSPIILMPWQ